MTKAKACAAEAEKRFVMAPNMRRIVLKMGDTGSGSTCKGPERSGAQPASDTSSLITESL